jgi:fermentation-respiration switch protein FrsA (DUF1100 family)
MTNTYLARGWPGKIWRVLGPVAIVYLVLVVLVYFLQRKLLYFPTRSAVPAPEGDQFKGLETVALNTSDGLRIFAWYWPGARPVTLVIFHGNAGNRLHRLEWMEDLHALGVGVFILDYRGYGGSEGSPSEAGLYRDAEAAAAWLQERGASNLVYFGESLGTGVAVELALRRPPAALILQSAFTSAVDVGAKAYSFLPVRLLMKDRYENMRKLSTIRAPVLVIHGEKDEMISSAAGRVLYEVAGGPKEWLLVPGAGHNDLTWVGGRFYLEAIDRFVRTHLEGASAAIPERGLP